MSRLLPLLGLVLSCLAPPSAYGVQDGPSAASGSVLTGAYTEEQASRGELLFSDICSACHDTSEFVGDPFVGSWEGSSLGALFEYLVTSMPEDAPGILRPDEYAAAISYILRLNGYPAGASPLPHDVAALGGIPFERPVEGSDAGAGGGSVLAGVYTEGQAGRGELLFTDICSACHDTSEFVGDPFIGAWAGSSLGGLFEYLMTSMPEDAPGILRPDEYADALSYLLLLNRYPTGESELPSDMEALRDILLEPPPDSGSPQPASESVPIPGEPRRIPHPPDRVPNTKR